MPILLVMTNQAKTMKLTKTQVFDDGSIKLYPARSIYETSEERVKDYLNRAQVALDNENWHSHEVYTEWARLESGLSRSEFYVNA